MMTLLLATFLCVEILRHLPFSGLLQNISKTKKLGKYAKCHSECVRASVVMPHVTLK